MKRLKRMMLVIPICAIMALPVIANVGTAFDAEYSQEWNDATAKVEAVFKCEHKEDFWKDLARDVGIGAIGALIGGVVAFLVNLLTKQADESSRRKVALTAAAAYFDSYIGDVRTGIDIMNNLLTAQPINGLMPDSSWKTYDLPTEIVSAVLCAIKGNTTTTVGFPANEFMRHTKNYFVNICSRVNKMILDKKIIMEDLRELSKNSKDVLAMLEYIAKCLDNKGGFHKLNNQEGK